MSNKDFQKFLSKYTKTWHVQVLESDINHSKHLLTSEEIEEEEFFNPIEVAFQRILPGCSLNNPIWVGHDMLIFRDQEFSQIIYQGNEIPEKVRIFLKAWDEFIEGSNPSVETQLKPFEFDIDLAWRS